MFDAFKNFVAAFAALGFAVPFLCAADVPAGGKPAPDYDTDIAQIFARGGCASLSCHGAVAGAGGLKMALFSGDNAADYAAMTRAYKGRLFDFNIPERSLVLRKLSGELAHGGGALAPKGGADYESVIAWIKNGAPFKIDGKIKPVSLDTPAKTLVLNAGESARPQFEVVMSDGSKKDVTGEALISFSKSGVAEVAADATIKALKPGITIVNASYMRRFVSLNLFVPSLKKPPKAEEQGGNEADKLINAKLELMGFAPSPLCTDAEFLKRAYLDTTGFLPSAEVAEAFLRSAAKDKRALLIDKLLQSDEFVDYLSMKLGDLLRIKSEFPSNLWPNAVQAYSTWIRNAVLQNMPYDVFARELLTTTGTNFRQPQVNFFRAVSEKTPENYADAASLVFMGLRLNCVKCHAHPHENWTGADARGMFAFFGKIYFKITKEWKEEILCVNYDAAFKDKDGKVTEPVFITGEKPAIKPDEDPRDAFALWLTSPSNPYFARAAVNRTWFWLMDKGIIDPADDIRPNNLPSNPELLEYLENEFIKSSYNLKALFRLIMNSNAYQRSCRPTEFNAEDDAFFSHRRPSRLYAENINDIVINATGESTQFKSVIPEPYSFWPEGFKAVQMSDGSVTNTLLALFGKPPRNASYLNDRECALTMSQVLYMASSSDIDSKIQKSQFLTALSAMKVPNAQKARKLYLTFLARFPTDAELKIAEAYLNTAPPERGVKDLAWALVNTKEFMFKF